jgi:hypothetical protein
MLLPTLVLILNNCGSFFRKCRHSRGHRSALGASLDEDFIQTYQEVQSAEITYATSQAHSPPCSILRRIAATVVSTGTVTALVATTICASILLAF